MYVLFAVSMNVFDGFHSFVLLLLVYEIVLVPIFRLCACLIGTFFVYLSPVSFFVGVFFFCFQNLLTGVVR